MDLENFMTIYRSINKKNYCIETGPIRFIDDHNNRYCPITLVCKHVTGKYFDIGTWYFAATEIGISYDDAKNIACSADNMFNCDRLYSELLKDI